MIFIAISTLRTRFDCGYGILDSTVVLSKLSRDLVLRSCGFYRLDSPKQRGNRPIKISFAFCA